MLIGGGVFFFFFFWRGAEGVGTLMCVLRSSGCRRILFWVNMPRATGCVCVFSSLWSKRNRKTDREADRHRRRINTFVPGQEFKAPLLHDHFNQLAEFVCQRC